MRLQLHALVYNLANFLRTLATLPSNDSWSLTSQRQWLIKTGVRLVRHARYAVFHFPEEELSREAFASALDRINGLRGTPKGMASTWRKLRDIAGRPQEKYEWLTSTPPRASFWSGNSALDGLPAAERRATQAPLGLIGPLDADRFTVTILTNESRLE